MDLLGGPIIGGLIAAYAYKSIWLGTVAFGCRLGVEPRVAHRGARGARPGG